MLVDWFTIAAQAVNFVVLVAILRYFLYGRIIKTVEARERDIESRLEEAEHQQTRAAQAAKEQDERERQWEQDLEKRLTRAKEDVEDKKNQLMDDARDEVEGLRRRWNEALENDKASFLRDLRAGIGRHAYEMARDTLADLADEELERHVVRVFRCRLDAMDTDRKTELRNAVQGSGSGVTIVSAFEIPESDRNELADHVREALGRAVDVRFEVSPDAICGIELLTDGHKAGFSVGSRMQRLEEWVDETIGSETGEGSKP